LILSIFEDAEAEATTLALGSSFITTPTLSPDDLFLRLGIFFFIAAVIPIEQPTDAVFFLACIVISFLVEGILIIIMATNLLTKRGELVFKGLGPDEATATTRASTTLNPVLVWHNPACFASYISPGGTLHLWIIKPIANTVQAAAIKSAIWNLAHVYANLSNLSNLNEMIKISLVTWAFKELRNGSKMAVDTSFIPMYPTRSGHRLFNDNMRAMDTMTTAIAQLVNDGAIDMINDWAESYTGAEQFRENHVEKSIPVFMTEILIRPRKMYENAVGYNGRLRTSLYLGYLPQSIDIIQRSLVYQFFYDENYDIDWRRAELDDVQGINLMQQTLSTTSASGAAMASSSSSSTTRSPEEIEKIAAGGNLQMYKALLQKARDIQEWAMARELAMGNNANEKRMNKQIVRNVSLHVNALTKIKYNKLSLRLFSILMKNLEHLEEVVRIADFTDFDNSDDGIPPIIASIWISNYRLINTFLT